MHVIVGKEAVTEGRGFNDVQNRKGVVEAEPGSRVAVEQLGPSTSPSKVMYPRWCVFSVSMSTNFSTRLNLEM